MPVSRRQLVAAGLAVPFVSAASLLFAERKAGRPAGGRGGYHSSLVNGLTPKRVDWAGYSWSADMGSAWNPGMDHSFQYSDNAARFEIDATPLDRGENDPPRKRRSELHCTKTLLPNGVPLWGAMSFNHHGWSDPGGMAQLEGGAHGQVHMHKFGGSPAVAFRRHGDGRFLVTTRGELDQKNNKRWIGQLPFNQVHDLVYRLLLDPSNGQLDVWLNGLRIVSLRAASIGSSVGGCYWCIGCYYGGGVTCPVVAEFANHEFPSQRDLARRITAAPAWPVA